MTPPNLANKTLKNQKTANALAPSAAANVAASAAANAVPSAAANVAASAAANAVPSAAPNVAASATANAVPSATASATNSRPNNLRGRNRVSKLVRSKSTRKLLNNTTITNTIKNIAKENNTTPRAEDIQTAELAVKAATTIAEGKIQQAQQESSEVIAYVQGEEIKRDLEDVAKAKTALEYFTLASHKAKEHLPLIFKTMGVGLGTAAAAATGIGLPVVIAVSIAVTTAMHAFRQKLEIRNLLNAHFRGLLQIIRNFALIEQTLKLLQVDVPVFDSQTGEPIVEITNGQKKFKREFTHVKLSNSFQKALVEYGTLVASQKEVDIPLTNSLIKRHFKMAKESISSLITASRVLARLTVLFAEIERQYFLEVARFTTLMFYNDANFERIKDIIKNGKTYHRLVTSDTIYQVPDCKSTMKSGKDTICNFTMAQLKAELDRDIKELFLLVDKEDIQNAVEISKIMTTGTDAIVQQSLAEYSIVVDSVPNIAKAKAMDMIQLAIKGVKMGINAGVSSVAGKRELNILNQQQREAIELEQLQETVEQSGKGYKKTYKRRNRNK